MCTFHVVETSIWFVKLLADSWLPYHDSTRKIFECGTCFKNRVLLGIFIYWYFNGNSFQYLQTPADYGTVNNLRSLNLAGPLRSKFGCYANVDHITSKERVKIIYTLFS